MVIDQMLVGQTSRREAVQVPFIFFSLVMPAFKIKINFTWVLKSGFKIAIRWIGLIRILFLTFQVTQFMLIEQVKPHATQLGMDLFMIAFNITRIMR